MLGLGLDDRPLSVEPEVYKDCAARFTGEHRDAIEEVVRKLHLPPCPNKNPNLLDGPDRIVELFFEEFKQFRSKLWHRLTKPTVGMPRLH